MDMRNTFPYLLAVLLTTAVATGSSSNGTKEEVVGAEFRNVVLHVGHGVVLDIRELDGRLLSRHPGNPPVFDDIDSYMMAIDRATVSMTPESLTSLMNNYIFAD